jgi:hypothetical protein
VFTEKSFTDNKLEFPVGILRQETIYTVESRSKFDPKFGWTTEARSQE